MHQFNYNKTIRVSLDIESTGLKPGCGIWQIGAVAIGQDLKFRFTVDPEATLAAWDYDPKTVQWQETTNRFNWGQAHTSFNSSVVVDALNSFSDFYRSLGDPNNIELWVKGPHFDIAILEAAYDKYGLVPPWKYNSIRDMRTLESLFPHVKVQKPGGTHDALVDATWQAEIIEACHAELKAYEHSYWLHKCKDNLRAPDET